MNLNYEQLIEIKYKFQSKIENPNLEFTYIAPKEEKLHRKFLAIVEKQPTISGSFYEILNNPNKVESLLQDNFPKEIELDIYYRINDTMFPLEIDSSLKEFIRKKGIKFDF